MIEEKNNTKNKIIKGVAMLGLFLMVVGISYALFKVTLNGKKTNKIKTAKFGLILTDKNGVEEKNLPDGVMGVNLTNAVPTITSEALATIEPYEFNLVNTGDVPIRYTLSLEVPNSATLPADKVRYHLQRTDTDQILSVRYPSSDIMGQIDEGNDITSISSRLLSMIDSENSEENSKLYKLDLGVIGPHQTQSYALRLWVSYNAGTEINDTLFSGNLKIDGVQASKDDAYVVRQYKIQSSKDEYVIDDEIFNLYVGKFSDNSIRFFGLGTITTNDERKIMPILYEMNVVANLETLNNILAKYNIDAVVDGNDFYDKAMQCFEVEGCGETIDPIIFSEEENDGFNGEIYFDDGVLGINYNSEGSMFSDRPTIKKVYISTTVNYFGEFNFLDNNSNLTDVIFTKNKNRLIVEERARLVGQQLAGCPSLKNVYLEDNIEYIGSNVFSGSPNVNLVINAKNSDVEVENGAFNNISSVNWLK